MLSFYFFFFKQKTAYEMRISDWSSDVCSSDLAIARVDADHAHAHVLGHGRHHLVAFLPAQQAGVDEYAGQLVADRPVQQRGNDRRIDAAREAEDHFVRTDLLAHARNLVVDDVGRRPQRLRSEEHTSELQSLMRISYAVFCLKKKKNKHTTTTTQSRTTKA